MSEARCSTCGRKLPAGVAETDCLTCLLSAGLSPDDGTDAAGTWNEAGSAAETPDQFIGRYRLREVIGEGGFGVVWLAEQEEPIRRQVALKIIKLGMDTRAVVARFEAERQALALMDHPNIARVFDGGATDAGRPYFVMELVRGQPITAFCDDRRLTTRERLELFITVCQAVQHAHQKGIIHRDLKPSNLLVVEQDGRAVPKVIDFGIARATEERLTDKTVFTRQHQFLGTPAYMSPEQAGLGGLDIDTRSDIYSLGVLLYELLAGRPPFDARQLGAAGVEAALRTIREQEPPRPSTRLGRLTPEAFAAVAARRGETPAQLNRRLRGELDWIVLKAVEKDRTRRYESANDLAADLRRHLNHEPVTAVPPTLRYQFGRFARKQRAVLATAAAVATVLLAGGIATAWQAVRATQASSEARSNLAQARLNAYASEMNVAQQALAENNLERTLELLDRQRPKPGETDDLRGFEWRYLWQLCQGNERDTFRDAPPGAWPECAVAFSPEGRFLAYSGAGRVVIRDAKSRQVVTNLPVYANTLAFSPGGHLLAAAQLWSGPVRLWNTATWTEVPVHALTNTIAPALFSPDGRWLVTATAGTNLFRLWDTETWEPVASCPQTPFLDMCLRSAIAFSPDGKLLVTPWMQVPRDGQAGLYLWKVPTLEKHAALFPPEIPLQSAAFLPDGKHLVAGGWLGHLLVWDLESNPPRRVQQEREHTATTPALAVAPGARTFVTGSADQSIGVWDVSTRKRIARWRGHRREVWAVAMSPDGGTVVSSSPDGTIRLWNGEPHDTGEVINDAGDVAGFTPDGRTVVIAPGEGNYRWQLVTGTNRVDIPIPPEPPLVFAFTRPYALTGSEPLGALGRTEGRVEIWDLAARRLVAAWNAGTNYISAVAFSPDGTRLATGDGSAMVQLWDRFTGAEITQFKAASSWVSALFFSPDGKLLVTGNTSSRETRVWNLATRELVVSLDVAVNQIAFAPDGKSLVTCSVADNEAQIWELPSGRRRAPLKGHVGGVIGAAFSPDGQTLATGAYDGRIKLWNLAIGQEVATIPYTGMMTTLQFSPDGRTLATSLWLSPGYQVRLFRAPKLEEIAAAEKVRSRTLQIPAGK